MIISRRAIFLQRDTTSTRSSCVRGVVGGHGNADSMDRTAGLPKTSSNGVISVVDCFDVLMENTALAILSSQSEWCELTNAASVEAMELFILSTKPFVSGCSAEACTCLMFHLSQKAEKVKDVKHGPLSDIIRVGVTWCRRKAYSRKGNISSTPVLATGRSSIHLER